jgi:hypothetical protein
MNLHQFLTSASGILAQHIPIKRQEPNTNNFNLLDFTKVNTNLPVGVSRDPVTVHKSLKHGDFRTWFEINRDFLIETNNTPAILTLDRKNLADVLKDPIGQLKFVASIASVAKENAEQANLVASYSKELSRIITSQKSNIECLSILASLDFSKKDNKILAKSATESLYQLAGSIKNEDRFKILNSKFLEYHLYTAIQILDQQGMFNNKKLETIILALDKKLEDNKLGDLRFALLPALIRIDTFRSQIIDSSAITDFFNSQSELKRHVLINLFSKDRENAKLIYSFNLISDFLPLLHFALNRKTKSPETSMPKIFDLGSLYGKLLLKLPAPEQIKLRYAIFEVLGESVQTDMKSFSRSEQKAHSRLGEQIDDRSAVVSLVRALEADKPNSDWSNALAKYYRDLSKKLDLRNFTHSSARMRSFN